MIAEPIFLKAGLLLFFFGVSISLIVLKGLVSARQELQHTKGDPRDILRDEFSSRRSAPFGQTTGGLPDSPTTGLVAPHQAHSK